MPYPYDPPEFLLNQSADDIHERMLAALPDDIDKSEGGIPWDYTRPSALEKAEFAEYSLNETIKLMFPHWASGEWLDLHAEKAGISRNEATKAYGVLTVTGVPGTVVPKGSQFATPANLTPSIIFEAIEESILSSEIDEDGQASMTIGIVAAEGGTDGNVPPDSVKLMVEPVEGITYITNIETLTGGTPQEDDDDLRERVIAAMQHGVSFAGCPADYVQWAMDVSDVGNAVCVPEANGPGTVSLIIIDKDGLPANENLLNAVKDKIMGTEAKAYFDRLAPIGAQISISSPEEVKIDIRADTITLAEGTEPENRATLLADVTSNFKATLERYWKAVAEEAQDGSPNEAIVRYTKISAALADTLGVEDFAGLVIRQSKKNGPLTEGEWGTGNINIGKGQYPVTGSIELELNGEPMEVSGDE